MCKACIGYYSGGWRYDKDSFKGVLHEIAMDAVNRSLEHRLLDAVTNVSILKVEEKGKALEAELEVGVTGQVLDIPYTTALNTTLVIRKVLCPICSRRAGRYYEATIQLRSDSIEKPLTEVHAIIDRLYRKNKMAFIVEESLVKGGVDIKLGSHKAAKAVSTHFKKHHGALVKESATLVGRKEGKDLYRTTVLIKVK